MAFQIVDASEYEIPRSKTVKVQETVIQTKAGKY